MEKSLFSPGSGCWQTPRPLSPHTQPTHASMIRTSSPPRCIQCCHSATRNLAQCLLVHSGHKRQAATAPCPCAVTAMRALKAAPATAHGTASGGELMRAKTVWNVIQNALWAWWADNCMRLSASLAFYTALSLAPLVMIVVGLAGLVTERQLVTSQLAQQIELLMGPPGRQLVGIILTTTEPGGGTVAAIIGFATLFIGATAVFGELQAALNLIWEVKPAPLRGAWAML